MKHGLRIDGMKPTLAHLLWIPLTASVNFSVAFLFTDLLRLPSGIYHLLYFGVVLALFFSYSWMTQANISGATRFTRW